MAYTGFAWIADAMEIMLLSYLAPAAQCAFDLTSGQVSFLSSIVFIGVAIGAWVWSPIADFFGRKRGFAITGIGTAIFSIATALAPTYWALLVFRFLVGVGLGGVPIIFSLFAEFVPTKRRGVALVAIQVCAACVCVRACVRACVRVCVSTSSRVTPNRDFGPSARLAARCSLPQHCPRLAGGGWLACPPFPCAS